MTLQNVETDEVRMALDQLVTDDVVSFVGATQRPLNPTIRYIAAVQE
jgi:hypothetical protein